MKYYLLLFDIIILTTLFSCQMQDKKESPTYTITKSNFEDFLTIDGFVEPAQSTMLTCPKRCEGIVTYIVDDATYVKDSDVVCVIEDKGLKTRYNESVINLEIAVAGLNKTKADLNLQYALMEAQVKNNAAETDIANLDSIQMQYLAPKQRRIKELGLEMVAIEKHKLQKKLQSLAIINQSELRKSEFEIQRFTNDIKNSKEQMDGLIIKSNKKGRIYRAMHYSGRKVQVGDNVWDGMAMVNMPDLSKMKVKIFASEGNYKRINVNDIVQYSFDAMPQNKAWGKILNKSPIGVPVKQDSKVKIFEIEASIDSSVVIPEPGLTTNCKIILKRINDTIVIPQISIFEQDSMKVVYVKNSEKYEMRQVIIGTSSPKSATIVAGLRRNEKISFIKPKSSMIEKKKLLAKTTLKKFKLSNNNDSKKKLNL